MKKNYFLFQLVFICGLLLTQASNNLPNNDVPKIKPISYMENVLQVSEDAYVRAGRYANDNFGSSTELFVKTTTNDDFVRETLMKFDLSNYETITSAKIFFYAKAQVSMNVNVYGVDNDSWSENSVTWNNAPSLNTNLGAVALTANYSWVDLDVSSAVINDFSASDKTFSIGLKDNNNIRKTITINSKENSAQFVPYIEIEGTLVGSGGTNPARDVYLVIGQSNTAGRGAIEAQDMVALNGVDLFNGSSWESAVNTNGINPSTGRELGGLNRYSTVLNENRDQGLNYSYTFGRTLNQQTGNQIGLVVNARGGTNINGWAKGASEGYYAAAITQINLALATPNTTLKGVLWHQGESNRSDSNYLTKLSAFIANLRSDLGISDLPFIAGQISMDRADNATFNTNLKTLPSLVSNTDYTESDSLGTTDLTHFDSSAQRVLGERYASKVLGLVYGTGSTCDVLIDENNFNSTWGIWNDGGSDCRRNANDAGFSNGGTGRSVRLRDNTSTSVTTTDLLDLSDYSQITVDFNYIADSVEPGEDFWLQISTNGGNNYQTVGDWDANDEFVNGIRYFENVTIQGPFTSNTRLRFRMDASANQDLIYIDDVKITGCLGSGPASKNVLTQKEELILVDYEPIKEISKLIYTNNPIENELIIKSDSIIENVTIFSLSGVHIRSERINDYSSILNVSSLQSGTYVLVLYQGNKRTTKLVVKK